MRAESKCAFCENVFTVGQDSRIWNAQFRTCLPGAPQGQPTPQCRATAYADLQIIRRLRNRIAHHEPIFMRNIADDYQRIHDMIAWRSQVAAAWMDRTQAVLALLAEVGRASCRERVCQYVWFPVGAGTLEKKTT